MPFSFTLEKTKGTKRAGVMTTDRGVVHTPIFMPVGTQATVKALDTQDISETQAEIILANTYHLYLRPGMETVDRLGGVQHLMGWDRPMLTDSGGFQVFSLGKQLTQKGESTLRPARVDDTGVTFTSHLDGSTHVFTPSTSLAIQQYLGADIIMAFDECTPDTNDPAVVTEALTRTHRWAEESIAAWEHTGRKSRQGTYQALFGIVQGGQDQAARLASAQFIAGLPFDGVAVGGETIGYNMPMTATVMEWIEPTLPADKPRYAMGLGSNPQDILDAIAMGFDMFDCVAPTRLARNGALYIGSFDPDSWNVISDGPKHRLLIGNSQYTHDDRPIQAGCDCHTCSFGYTRAYLHHLYKTQELAYYRLASMHNVRFMVRLSQLARGAILVS